MLLLVVGRERTTTKAPENAGREYWSMKKAHGLSFGQKIIVRRSNNQTVQAEDEAKGLLLISERFSLSGIKMACLFNALRGVEDTIK